MSTRLNHLKVVLLTAAIASFLGLTGCQPEGFTYDPQTGQLVTVTPPASPLQTPPSPAATLGPSQPQTRMPYPTPGPAQPSDVTPPVFPTLSPWPTFTPWPTPTRRPGPTATALPLPQPAKDATGTIFYAVRTDFSPGLSIGDIHRSQVDSVGNLSAVAQPIGINWLRAYPSWDFSLVAFVDSTMGGDRIYIVNPQTGQITPVEEAMHLDGRFLGWHPNNQEVLYLAEVGPRGGLWLLNFATGEHTIVVMQDPLYIRDASMSPDGQRIVYSYQKQVFEPGEIWTVNADGSDPRLLFGAGGTMIGLTWSPDGSKIALVDQSQGLVVMNPDGTDRRVVARDFAWGYLFEPVWSPDSRYLAYVAGEPEVVPPEIAQQDKAREVQDWDREAFLGSNIHIIDISDGQERTLVSIKPTGQIEGNIDPAWSPDGQLLAFAALREGQAGLWVVNIDGTGLRQLAEAPNLIRFPAWTRRTNEESE